MKKTQNRRVFKHRKLRIITKLVNSQKTHRNSLDIENKGQKDDFDWKTQMIQANIRIRILQKTSSISLTIQEKLVSTCVVFETFKIKQYGNVQETAMAWSLVNYNIVFIWKYEILVNICSVTSTIFS